MDVDPASRERVADSVTLALNEGNGEIIVRSQGQETFFSNRLHCPRCDISLGEPQPGTVLRQLARRRLPRLPGLRPGRLPAILARNAAGPA